MTRHTGILMPRPETFFDERVAMANAAGFDLHAHLARAGFGNVSLNEFPFTPCFAFLCCLHFRVHYHSYLVDLASAITRRQTNCWSNNVSQKINSTLRQPGLLLQ